ncbi:putative uncharacterized protein DDB_G0282499 [Oppia nitens]|uniref:putative uncharacterized protein DDB_G0282499 n=1 Tax=Oppia nitens TaxID=1686743 RepID=UPI0023DBC76C|nr:putative uncharacterized protein DDB_G0282499 [Oppia nitens]
MSTAAAAVAATTATTSDCESAKLVIGQRVTAMATARQSIDYLLKEIEKTHKNQLEVKKLMRLVRNEKDVLLFEMKKYEQLFQTYNQLQSRLTQLANKNQELSHLKLFILSTLSDVYKQQKPSQTVVDTDQCQQQQQQLVVVNDGQTDDDDGKQSQDNNNNNNKSMQSINDSSESNQQTNQSKVVPKCLQKLPLKPISLPKPLPNTIYPSDPQKKYNNNINFNSPQKKYNNNNNNFKSSQESGQQNHMKPIKMINFVYKSTLMDTNSIHANQVSKQQQQPIDGNKDNNNVNKEDNCLPNNRQSPQNDGTKNCETIVMPSTVSDKIDGPPVVQRPSRWKTLSSPELSGNDKCKLDNNNTVNSNYVIKPDLQIHDKNVTKDTNNNNNSKELAKETELTITEEMDYELREENMKNDKKKKVSSNKTINVSNSDRKEEKNTNNNNNKHIKTLRQSLMKHEDNELKADVVITENRRRDQSSSSEIKDKFRSSTKMDEKSQQQNNRERRETKKTKSYSKSSSSSSKRKSSSKESKNERKHRNKDKNDTKNENKRKKKKKEKKKKEKKKRIDSDNDKKKLLDNESKNKTTEDIRDCEIKPVLPTVMMTTTTTTTTTTVKTVEEDKDCSDKCRQKQESIVKTKTNSESIVGDNKHINNETIDQKPDDKASVVSISGNISGVNSNEDNIKAKTATVQMINTAKVDVQSSVKSIVNNSNQNEDLRQMVPKTTTTDPLPNVKTTTTTATKLSSKAIDGVVVVNQLKVCEANSFPNKSTVISSTTTTTKPSSLVVYRSGNSIAAADNNDDKYKPSSSVIVVASNRLQTSNRRKFVLKR